MVAVYTISGPAVALATFNATELSEGYAAIVESCLGDKRFGFLPVPKSYIEGTLCTAMLLTCLEAAAEGLGNPKADAACASLIRTLSEKTSS